MTLIVCHECGESISDQAKNCPKCGAPVKKKTSSYTAIIFIMIVLLIVVNGLSNSIERKKAAALSNSTISTNTAISQNITEKMFFLTKEESHLMPLLVQGAKRVKEENSECLEVTDADLRPKSYQQENNPAFMVTCRVNGNPSYANFYFTKHDLETKVPITTERNRGTNTPSQWYYSSNEDEMTGKSIYQAETSSLNTAQFEFPYSGEQHATLILRTHPRYGKDVILTIEKGQFLCGVSGCSVLVRFDDGQPVTFSAVEPADNDSTTIFIQNYSGFAARMLKAKRVRMQATFYREGDRTFEFDVSKFNVNEYRPATK